MCLVLFVMQYVHSKLVAPTNATIYSLSGISSPQWRHATACNCSLQHLWQPHLTLWMPMVLAPPTKHLWYCDCCCSCYVVPLQPLVPVFAPVVALVPAHAPSRVLLSWCCCCPPGASAASWFCCWFCCRHAAARAGAGCAAVTFVLA